MTRYRLPTSPRARCCLPALRSPPPCRRGSAGRQSLQAASRLRGARKSSRQAQPGRWWPWPSTKPATSSPRASRVRWCSIQDKDHDGKFETGRHVLRQGEELPGHSAAGRPRVRRGRRSLGYGLLSPDRHRRRRPGRQGRHALQVQRRHGRARSARAGARPRRPDLHDDRQPRLRRRRRCAKTSPHHHYYDGELFTPKYEDANGHAAGIKAPGGTVVRTDTNGSFIELFVGGFRNAYDHAFNRDGELFTYDSRHGMGRRPALVSSDARESPDSRAPSSAGAAAGRSGPTISSIACRRRSTSAAARRPASCSTIINRFPQEVSRRALHVRLVAGPHPGRDAASRTAARTRARAKSSWKVSR